jgi:hypothetical protein
MDPLLNLSLDRGYFLRREALAFGVTDRQLTSGVRHGALVRIRQGAYCHKSVWKGLSDSDRHLARCHASYDLALGDVAISHVSALVEYGCPTWRVPLDAVHLNRMDQGSSRREAGIVHHRGILTTNDIIQRHGRNVTNPTRSTVDGLSLMSTESGIVSGDWMLHHGLTDPESLWAMKTRHNHWPNTRVLEITLRLLDGKSESPGESRARFLFWLMHLPKPELQYEVFDNQGNLVAVTDFAWPGRRVYGEFDGKVKYGRLLKPGQDPGEVVFAEKRREDSVRRATNGTMVRFTWTELHMTSEPSLQLQGLLLPRSA